MTREDQNLPVPVELQSRSVQLHDNGLRAGNLIQSAISRLDERQIQALGVKAAEAVLELQKREQQQNLDYVVGRKVVLDHLDAWNSLDKDGWTKRQKVTTDVETGAGRMRIESKSGATCFIASAAYGDPNHPEVMYLRWYRDAILARSAAGRAFTRLYWLLGPKLARLVEPHPTIRGAARRMIASLIRLIQWRHGHPKDWV